MAGCGIWSKLFSHCKEEVSNAWLAARYLFLPFYNAHTINIYLEYHNLLYTNKCNENFVILQSIGTIAIKVVKQGQLSTPADILMDNRD